MNLIKKASISFLSLVIVACGGGGSPAEKSDTAKTEDTITGAVTVGTPNIGRGSAGTFVSSELELQLATISSGGTSNITASVVDSTKSNALIDTKPYAVVFTSSCEGSTPAKAEFSAKTVITNSGSVSTAYTAKGCVGTDQITATLYNASGTPAVADTTQALAKASAQVTVEIAEFGAISFVSVSESRLGFPGIGNSGLQSSSLFTFKVVDNFGNPLEGKEVTFSIPNGTSSSLSTLKATTNPEGLATTTLNAGTTHSSIAVTARTIIVPDAAKPTETMIKEAGSPAVSISTGLAVQHRMSLTADNYNPNAFNSTTDVNISVVLSDRYGNFVPDDTLVKFVAESGAMPDSCPIKDGKCTVVWTSSGDRPGEITPNSIAGTKNQEYLPVPGATLSYALQNVKGFTNILAYVIGEPSFTDTAPTINGIYDLNEPFGAYQEVFSNDNGNYTIVDGAKIPTFDTGEEVFEHVSDGSFTTKPDKYQGPLCSVAAQNDGHCNQTSILISKSITIMQSAGDQSYSVSFYDQTAINTYTQLNSLSPAFDVSADGTLYVLVTDANGNLPASGTTIAFSAENFKEVDSSVVSNAESPTFFEAGFPVARGLLVKVNLEPDAGAVATQLEVSIPGGTGKVTLNITP